MKWYSQVLSDFGIYLKDYEDFNTSHRRRPVWARFANEELYTLAWQKTKETYFWRFVLAVGIVPFLVVPFIWFRIGISRESVTYVYYTLAFLELFAWLIHSKSSYWNNGFWIGVYADDFEYGPLPATWFRRSLEAKTMTNHSTKPYEVEFDKVQRTKRLMYLLVTACLGVLIICNSFEAISDYSFIVWFYLVYVIEGLGRAIGEEVGLKKGFSMRESLQTTPSEASLFSLSSADPHAAPF